MSKEMLETAYDSWVSSEGYDAESTTRNGVVDRGIQEISELFTFEDVDELLDRIICIACETEACAFEQGFRHGIMFLMNMREGVSCGSTNECV